MKVITTLYSLTPETFRAAAIKRVYVQSLTQVSASSVFAWLAVEKFIPSSRPMAALTLVLMMLALCLIFATPSTLPSSIMKLHGTMLSRRRLMEFDEEGISTRWETGSSSNLVWSDVLKVVRLKNQTVIYLSTMFIVQVPDYAFPSSNEVNQLLALLRSKNLIK